MFLFSNDLGVDLGTSNVLIYADGKGLVVREPSVVAMDKNTGKILQVGAAARNMLGRTPGNVVAMHPLKDGTVSDHEMTVRMLQEMFKTATKASFFTPKPRVVISVPSGVSEVEERSVINAAIEAGARRVFLIEEPLAAGLGAGLDIRGPSGHLVVDIGGGTTDIAIFANDSIKHTHVLALGGQNLTNDIAFGLRTPIAAAERIKLKYGCALTDMVRHDEFIEVPTVGGRDPSRISRQILAEICEPRMEEILCLVNRTLENSGYKNFLGAGVVLTGGTALIEGCQELGTQIFNLPTRIGYPRNVGGLKDVVNSPKFSTAVGLLRYGAEKEVSGQKKFTPTHSDSGVFEGLLARMKKWFSDIS